MKKIFLAFVLLLIFGTLSAQQNIAFLGVTNRSEHLHSDYLGGIIEGILLFDLSKMRTINLVERNELDRIVEEQSLSLYGLTDESAGQIGRIVQADRLLSCEYIAGDTLRLTAKLIDVATSEISVLSISGTTENTIHAMAEMIVSELGAGSASFVVPEENRSLFTLKDMTPGYVKLYCNLLNAEILLNDEFIGYTRGDLYTPVELPDIDPGTYTLRVNLGRDFGVIKLPEVTFHDWTEEISIRPGRGTVVRAIIYDFTSQIRELAQLVNGQHVLNEEQPRQSVRGEETFVDRKGTEHSVKLSLDSERRSDKGSITGSIIFDETEYRIQAENNHPFEEEFGLIKIKITVVDYSNNTSKVWYRVERNDINQGMHR